MPLPDSNPNIWRHQAGGGCASLFGLPFFVVGIGVIALTFIPVDVRGGDAIPFFFGIPFGSIFAIVGGAILFGRLELLIDRESGIATKNWKLLTQNVKTQTYQTKDFNRVSLRSEVRRSKNSSYTVYPVRLTGSDDNQLDISQSRSEKEARSDAEEIAKFLSLPIHDETSGSTRIREADLLDENIKDKFKKRLETNEIPDPPAKLKSRINYDRSSLQIEIPPPGFNVGFLVVAVVICVFELIFLTTFAIPFLTQADVPGTFLIFAAFFGLIFLGLPTWFLIRLIGITFIATQSVSVGNNALKVAKGWPMRKTKSISTEEIEEFIMGVSKAGTRGSKAVATIGVTLEILAISDTDQLSFGAGLPPDELEYIYALAKGIMVS